MRKELLRDMAVVLAWTLLTLTVMTGAARADNTAPYPGTQIIGTKHSYKDLVARLDEAVKANKMGLVTRASATVGAKVDLNLRQLFFKSLSLLGSTMGSKAEFAEVLKHAGQGTLSPTIDRVLPLEQIGEAHRLLEERKVFGKIVLVV